MEYLKYLLQLLSGIAMAVGMLGSLFMVACVVIIFLYVPFPLNLILGIGSILFLRWVGKGKEESPLFWGWKSSNRRKFYKSWDMMLEGKVHSEIRNGERVTVIDSDD